MGQAQLLDARAHAFREHQGILENQATVDGLTGCLNRRGMENRLDEVLHGFGRGGVSERMTMQYWLR